MHCFLSKDRPVFHFSSEVAKGIMSPGWIMTRNHFTNEIECTQVGATVESINLEQCKNHCDATDGCTAFNYWTTPEACELRGCPRPVPTPISYNKNIKGYYRNEKHLTGTSAYCKNCT